jgi:hypothetical protein
MGHGNSKTILKNILLTSAMWRLQPSEYLIDGIILAGDNHYKDGAKLGCVMALYGPSGIGKTYLVLSWLLAIKTTTIDWCGRRTLHGEVLYFIDEGVRNIGTRERGWCAKHKIIEIPEFPHCPAMIDILNTDQVKEVGEEIAGWKVKPVVIVIDTWGSAIASGDEVKEMPKAMLNARRLSILTGACVLLIHHPNVKGDRERGGGQFRNKLDLLIEVGTVKDAPNFRVLTFHKARDDKKSAPILIELVEQDVNTPFGPKTTLVVEGPRTILDLPLKGMGALERTILKVFRNTEAFPDGMATWTALYEAVDAATTDQRKKAGAHQDRGAFSEALQNLVEVGVVLDDAAGEEPRPKGSLYRLASEIQPETDETEDGGASVGRSVCVEAYASTLIPTDPPTQTQSVEPFSTDPYRQPTKGSAAAAKLKNQQPKAATPAETADLVATGRKHLNGKGRDEKPS